MGISLILGLPYIYSDVKRYITKEDEISYKIFMTIPSAIGDCASTGAFLNKPPVHGELVWFCFINRKMAGIV